MMGSAEVKSIRKTKHHNSHTLIEKEKEFNQQFIVTLYLCLRIATNYCYRTKVIADLTFPLYLSTFVCG